MCKRGKSKKFYVKFSMAYNSTYALKLGDKFIHKYMSVTINSGIGSTGWLYDFFSYLWCYHYSVTQPLRKDSEFSDCIKVSSLCEWIFKAVYIAYCVWSFILEILVLFLLCYEPSIHFSVNISWVPTYCGIGSVIIVAIQ